MGDYWMWLRSEIDEEAEREMSGAGVEADLTTWLRAQLDDDERVAREAASDQPHWGLDIAPDGTFYVDPGPGADDLGNIYLSVPAQHIARWDPARVLAEVDGKRRILDRCEFLYEHDNECAPVILEALALPYADRPGYRQEWRP